MNPDSMTSEKSKEQRLLMVESQLVRRGISDNKVLKAIKSIAIGKINVRKNHNIFDWSLLDARYAAHSAKGNQINRIIIIIVHTC